MVRSIAKRYVSNHEARMVASSFETRFALLRMRIKSYFKHTASTLLPSGSIRQAA